MNDSQQLDRMLMLEDQLARVHRMLENTAEAEERAEYWTEIRSLVHRLNDLYLERYGASWAEAVHEEDEYAEMSQ